MKPAYACRACGRPFSPVKPWHVLCFTCYLKQIREAMQARAAVLGSVYPLTVNKTSATRRGDGLRLRTIASIKENSYSGRVSAG